MARAQEAPAAVPGLSLQLEGTGRRVQAPATPDYPLDNTGETEWTGGATALYRKGGDSYQLSFRHFHTDLGVCSCYRIDSAENFFAQAGRQRPNGADLYTSEARIERPYQAVSHELAMARGRWSIGTVGTLTGTYALQYDDRREFEIVRQVTTVPQYSFRLWTHDLDVGLEHNPIHLGEHLHLSGSAGVLGMVQVHTYDGLPLVPDHRAGAAGAYLIERLWGHSYELEAGLRYDFLARSASLLRRDFLRLVRSGQLAEDTCGAVDATTDPVACASAFHTVSASVGGLLRLGSRWSTKLDLSTASRPPNPDEQYLNGSAPSFPVFGLGQPDLRPETSYSASLTASYTGDRVAGEVSTFGNFISDYIYFAPAIGPDGKPIFDVNIRGAFPRFVTRAVDAAFYGADGQIAVTPVPWLELDVQASTVRARDVTSGSYLVFVPPDRARASIAFTRQRPLGLERATVSLSGTYVARQGRFDLAADLVPPPAAYFLAEAMVGVEGHLAGQSVKVALTGTNLLGARYREYTSLLRYFADQPGRQLMLRITASYASPKKSS
jgi:iron complex outermembrane receptor protein